MIRKRFAGTVLLAVVSVVVASAQPWAWAPDNRWKGTEKKSAAAADLLIREFVFTTGNEKTVRVQIVNAGRAASGLCILRLTLSKINGVPVSRVTEIKLPPLAPGKEKWLLLDAKNILPNNIALESTTFKLNADATSLVTESDEANNEVWHNP